MAKPALADKIYWVDGGAGKVQRANLDGSNIEDLVTGLNIPSGLALDLACGNMYFSDTFNNRVMRADLDGSNVEQIWTGLTMPRSVGLDANNGKVYWADLNGVKRANVSGTASEVIVSGGTAFGLDIDQAAGKLYWTSTSGGIFRADMDGSKIETLNLDASLELSLDTANRKMYWAASGGTQTGFIRRANLDGSNVETLVSGLNGPRGVAVDPIGQRLYFGVFRGGILRSDLSGQNLETVVPGLSIPGQIGLQLDANPPKLPLRVFPTVGGDTGVVTLTITGSGFGSGTTVKLTRAGQSDIVSQETRVGGSTGCGTIEATFDLTGQPRGSWDVIVTSSAGTSFESAGKFSIEEGRAPKLWANVIGPKQIRVARDTNFVVSYGNMGNIDANHASVFLALSKDVKAILNIEGSNNAFVYDPDMQPEAGDAGLTMVEAYLGRVPPGASKIISVTLNAPRSMNLSLGAAPFAHMILFGDVNGGNGLALSPISTALPAPSPPPPIRVWIVNLHVYYFDGHSKWTRHPFFQIGDTVYTQTGTGSQRYMEAFPISAFYAGLQNPLSLVSLPLEISGIAYYDYTSSSQPYSPNPPNLTNDLKQGADQAVSDGQSGQRTLRDCMQTWDDIAANVCDPQSGVCLDFMPNSGPEEDTHRAFCQTFNIDCSTSPTGWAPNREGPVLRFMGLIPIDLWDFHHIETVTAYDPNTKLGPSGVTESGSIKSTGPLVYEIAFENLDMATAPAQEVVIADQLDPSRVDLNSLTLGPMSFGKNLIVPPAGYGQYATEVDLRPGMDLVVRVTAGVDLISGIVSWRFASIQPSTGRPPDDPLAGFLPPNVTAPQGEGRVLFSVKAKQGLPTGTEIKNKASIVFDDNTAVVTREVLNTLDDDKPHSEVGFLAPTVQALSFPVTWTGMDAGAGVKDYTIYVSENDGPFFPWLLNTTETSGNFFGNVGSKYAFYSRARDLTGNIEDTHTAPDAVTTVVQSNQRPTANAGLPRTVEATSPVGGSVILDGSASNDPDGDPLAYTWTGPFGLGNGVKPTVVLPLGANTITLEVSDGKGGTASATVVITVVDTTPPTIAITSPGGSVYALGQAVGSSYSCQDSGSDVAACAGPVVSGSVIDTGSVGIKTFVVSATDKAGNNASRNVSYTVAYGICPLYDRTKSHKIGSTVPIKLQLCDSRGANVSASDITVSSTGLTKRDSTASSLVEDSGNANPDENFRFDPTLGETGGYIFNLSTKSLTTGTWVLNFTGAGDPTSHAVQFDVK